MKNTVLTLLMMIAVGVFASAQGRDTQTPRPEAVDAVRTQQPYVVLIATGTPRQKEASQECLVKPNRDRSRQQGDDQDSRTMKGLVF